MKYLYVILLTALACAPVAYKIHSWRVDSLRLDWKSEKEAAVAAAETAKASECEAAKAITQEVSDDYQKKFAALDAQLAAARGLLNPAACIAVHGGRTLGHDDAPAGQEPAGRGLGGADAHISAGRYIEIAGKGERYRLQLISCQSFVKKTQPKGVGGRK